MANRETLGGVIHTYLKFDPVKFPSPTAPPPDLVSSAFEHMLMFGTRRELTEDELARAVRIDPSQIAALGPSLEAIRAMLEERKQKILRRYETRKVRKLAEKAFRLAATALEVPPQLEARYQKAAASGQLRDLERLWYIAGDDNSSLARGLMNVIDRLAERYQIEELAARYEFIGHQGITIPQALDIKEELEKIDELLKQLEEAAQSAQIGVIDLELLAEFTEPGDVTQLSALQQQVQDYLREVAERQGLEQVGRNFRLTPKAYQIFQGKLLARLFSQIEASRTGRHQGNIVGEGAVELQATRPFEFGDSIANMDVVGTFTNALIRGASEAQAREQGLASTPFGPVAVPGSYPQQPWLRLRSEDIEIHRTRNTPKCATCVLMDMSGSMRYDGQYINVKRMALALQGLLRTEYPGDYLGFVELYSFARQVEPGKVIELMPKPVTITNPYVHLTADMSREDISEHQVPPHFTNIQHGLAIARRLLSVQDTPNRQIVLITDGLPTAHFEGEVLHLLYPPHPLTEEATMREGMQCAREGITINLFLLPSWSQSEEDIRFAYRLAESTAGRVFFTSGHDLDRYVVWDYLERRREIVG